MSIRALVFADRTPQPDCRTLLARERPELVITLGDLDAWQLAGLAEWEGAKMGVYGNHDRAYLPDLGVSDLHAATLEWRGLRWGGLEGCRRYKLGPPFMHSDQEVAALMRAFPPVDVMLTHCPPEGINDSPYQETHRGWPGLRAWMERCPPQVLLHGHAYPERPVERHGSTRVIYVSGWASVLLP